MDIKKHMFNWIHEKCREQYSFLLLTNKKLREENKELIKRILDLEQGLLQTEEPDSLLYKKIRYQRKEIRRLTTKHSELTKKYNNIRNEGPFRWIG
jgi:hypothetical protein